MKHSPRLVVSIVSYNTAQLTLQTLRSLCRDIERSNFTSETEVIIVDNHSRDNSVALLSAFAKSTPVHITLIENKKNVGFSRANNQAIQYSNAPFILLLNSDTYVQPHTIKRLLNCMEESREESTAQLGGYEPKIDRLGILAATLAYPDGTPQMQGGSHPTLWSLATHMLFLDDIPILGKMLPSTQHTGLRATRSESDALLPCDWVGGTAMLLRREMLNEIGLLDESIFMYAEDTELCMRARNHHWDVAIHPTAYVTHYQYSSSTNTAAVSGEFKGYLYIWKKHYPPAQAETARKLLKLGALLRKLVFGTIKQPERAQIYQTVLAEL